MSAGRPADPLEFGKVAGKGTVFGRQGVSIRYWLYGDAGDPIVLCNGLFSGVGLWKHFVQHFSRTHRIILWEYPGQGISFGTDSRNGVSIASYAENCLLLLEGVGVDKAVFVGHGVGVQVILELYRRHPGTVKALVGICGVEEGLLSRLAPFRKGQVVARSLERLLVPLGTPFWKALRQLWVASLPLRREALRRGASYGSANGNTLLDQVARADPRIGLRLLASTLFYHPGSPLPQIGVPFLILGGVEDRVVPTGRYLEMVKRVPGSRLVLLEGCSHQAMVQAPEKVHTLVEEFLAEHGAA